MLVWIGRVVLLGDVVAEQEIRQGLEAVGVPSRDVDRDRVVVADVEREGLTCLAVQHDDSRRPLETGEEVVLPALVVMQAADDPFPREGEVGLDGPLRQPALTPELHEPAPLVFEPAQRNDFDPFDHGLLAPFARTKSLTA